MTCIYIPVDSFIITNSRNEILIPQYILLQVYTAMWENFTWSSKGGLVNKYLTSFMCFYGKKRSTIHIYIIMVSKDTSLHC